MRAMTWYDHETESIWSQPLGRAMSGPRRGSELALLPSVITTWSEWKRDHPGTLALITDTDRLGTFRQVFDDDFVVGVVLGDEARAYYFVDILDVTGLNDQLGEFPILVWAQEKKFRAYLRRAGDQELTFQFEAGQAKDVETGTEWDMARGLAIAGPLEGEALQTIPSLSAYDWAWRDFYPEGSIYEFAR